MLKGLLLWSLWTGSAGADIASTHGALARGAHESHPALAGMAGGWRDATVLGSSAGMACLLQCSGYYKAHPRIAWTLTAVGAGLHTWATVHNLKQAR
jgi:hypothetical protein